MQNGMFQNVEGRLIKNIKEKSRQHKTICYEYGKPKEIK